MRPLKRKSVSKSKSIRRFSKRAERTPALNIFPAPMRGGIRL